MEKQKGEDMKTDPREIVIYYNPDINKHKKTIAHAKGITENILAIPFADVPEAYNVWTTIYEGLQKEVNPMGIFDDQHPQYDTLIKDRELDFRGWRNVIIHNPDIIRSPIAIRGQQVVFCDRQTEIYRLMDKSPSEMERKYAAGHVQKKE